VSTDAFRPKRISNVKPGERLFDLERVVVRRLILLALGGENAYARGLAYFLVKYHPFVLRF
jgi:hypothetical protein